jgi:hypothetical protein
VSVVWRDGGALIMLMLALVRSTRLEALRFIVRTIPDVVERLCSSASTCPMGTVLMEMVEALMMVCV